MTDMSHGRSGTQCRTESSLGERTSAKIPLMVIVHMALSISDYLSLDGTINASKAAAKAITAWQAKYPQMCTCIAHLI